MFAKANAVGSLTPPFKQMKFIKTFNVKTHYGYILYALVIPFGFSASCFKNSD
jgi:hypothetical protein